MRRRLTWVVLGLALAALGVAMAVLDVAVDYALPAIVIGALVVLVAGFARQVKGRADGANDDYHFEQERYEALDDDDDR